MSKTLLLCTCEGSQTLEPEAIQAATGLQCSRPASALCTNQIEQAAKAIEAGELVIACQQERAIFEELADELNAAQPEFLDLRDRAGWTDDKASTTPKMAALAAEAMLPAPLRKSVDVLSEGVGLIIGPSDVAIDLAESLADALSLTVCLTDDAAPPLSRRYEVIRGNLSKLQGALGGFDVKIDALQQLEPGGRGPLSFGAPRDGGRSQCDIIIDVSGQAPMVVAPHKREGYLRADPKDKVAIGRLATQAAQMIGVFEKPLYVKLESSLCAHSRAGQIGCSNCLDICPAGAILPDGDSVSIDPMICAGCGACAALCPSGAITYDDPPFDSQTRRIETLARVYRSAGGEAPRLLVHDAGHGLEMIQLAARFDRGLPGDVLPYELETVSGFGHAETLAALACGFASVDILVGPRTERDALTREIALAEAICGANRVRLLDPVDPEALCGALYDAPAAPAPVSPGLPMGTRRQVARFAAKAMNPEATTPLPLPEAAPYGAVLVNKDACTLCLSCVSLCPSGALGDNPDLPQLLFQEDACLQCGICATICPEKAIDLLPQLNLADEALSQTVLNEEEPFACIECGALFGVKSTIEKITEKLAGKHSMFANNDAAKMIQMCDNCRIAAQFKATDNPFAQGKPRVTRTTDDYLSDRKDH